MILPKFIRMRDAPSYLGMSPKVFNETVRPHVREVIVGIQGVAFDRDELDGWADDYIAKNAVDKKNCTADDDQRIGRRRENGGNTSWRARQSAASTSVTASGTSTKLSKVTEFKKALDLARGKKPSGT